MCGRHPSSRPGTSPAPARCPSGSYVSSCGPYPRMPTLSPTAAAPTACTPTTPCGCCAAGATGPGASRTGSPNGSEPVCLSQPGTEAEPMTEDLLVDPTTLREQVRDKYRDVALTPNAEHHFHTGRPLAARLGYDQTVVDALPDRAVESFAGVGNPFSLRRLVAGERVVDVGSGAGFDSFIAAGQVGPGGQVVGVDMTAEMLAKARQTAAALGGTHVEFPDGLAGA